MENTGRILRGLTPTARKIIFGESADSGVAAELAHVTRVDCAHLLMLAERGILEGWRVALVLEEIAALRAQDFAPLRGLSAPRGLFLLYENYLIERLGADTGGVLQTARSRNDLNATVLRLRLRAPYMRLLEAALRLQAVLLRRAERYAGVTMPAYTHYQAAVPVTYGHYLGGVAQAVGRDLAELFNALENLNLCPLGAGAVGGTTVAIDPVRTAALLGFDKPAANSIDAVASRDLVLRLLSSQAIFGVTLSRVAADLLLWSTSEFGFLEFDDELVGSSSMMPQKRNPFLLEHVQGRSTSALGAFTAAAASMHAKPYTNSISVGTEAVSHVWKTLQAMTEAATLARLVVAGARPQGVAMLRRAEQGYTQATEFANRLALEGGVSFRTAHKTVGSIIRGAVERGGEPLAEAAARWRTEENQALSLEGLDPAAIARAAVYGGGPGRASQEAALEALRDDWRSRRAAKRAQTWKWAAADAALSAALEEHLCAASVR